MHHEDTAPTRSFGRRSALWRAALIVLALATVAMVSPHAAGASPSTVAQAGCTLAPTNGTVTRIVGLRSYQLHVPAGLSGSQVPLLVSIHGFSNVASGQELISGWSQFADSHNFIVAYPQGLPGLLGAQLPGFWYAGPSSFDTAFLRQVVDNIAATYCIDPARIYADGHSNGAIMSQRLACDATDRFAAVVEYAGPSPTIFGACNPARPVAVGLFQGEADPIVPHASGLAARDEWVARNACSSTPVSEPVTDGTLLRYTGCAGGVEVLWRSYPGQDHGWPTGTRGDDQRNRMWAFLQAHPSGG